MFRPALACVVMIAAKGGKSRTTRGFVSGVSEKGEPTTEQTGSGLNRKSGTQAANTLARAVGKNDSRYWRSRIYRPINARREASPHYSMRLQVHGRRMAFSLGTGNAEAAARKAASVYTDFLTLGIEGALAKHRP